MTDVWTHATTRSVPDFPPGRYLVPAVVTDERTMTIYTADAFPDDRRPSWLPGQPGDITEVEPDGMRVMRDANGRWYGLGDAERVWRSDDEVPAGARLLLPARTREVTS